MGLIILLVSFTTVQAEGDITSPSYHSGIIEETSGITVKVNGRQIIFDQQPIMQNDRVLVPIRAVFEAMGAAVLWDGEIHIITRNDYIYITNEEINTQDDTGNTFLIYKNGSELYTDVSPIILNNRTLVPVRVIAEAFGANITWDNNTQTVNIVGLIEEEYRIDPKEIQLMDNFTIQKAVEIVESKGYIIVPQEGHVDYVNGRKCYYFEVWADLSQAWEDFDSTIGIALYYDGTIENIRYDNMNHAYMQNGGTIDDSFLCRVIPLPYEGSLAEGEIFNDVKNKYHVPNADIVRLSGDEIYIVIPKYRDSVITVKNAYYDFNVNEYHDEDIVYTGSNSIILICNPSDLYANCSIYVQWNDNKVCVRPQRSLAEEL